MSNTSTTTSTGTGTTNGTACNGCGKRIPAENVARLLANKRTAFKCPVPSCGVLTPLPGAQLELPTEPQAARKPEPKAEPARIARPIGTETPSGSEPRVPEAIRESNARAERAPSAGGAILGAVVWYDFVGVELPADDLVDLAKLSGIDESHVAGIRAHGALGRACRSANVPGFHPIRTHSDDTRLEYAFTRREGSQETEQDTGETRYVREDVQRVSYDRASKGLTFTSDWRQSEIRDAFARFRVNVTSEKVSETVRRVLDAAGAVRLRQLGVVYFVPASKLAELAKVKAFCSRLQALGHKGANVSDALLADAPETRETVRRGASEDIGSHLAQLEAKLTETIEASKQGVRRVRVSTFLGFREQAEILGEKGTCYAELAELKVEEIRARIETIKARVAEVAEVVEDEESSS